MPKCSKCGQKMAPKIKLDGAVADILKSLSQDTETMQWSCEACGIQRAAPLKPGDVEDVKAYIRRKKKKWWQFWVR
jgi:DNA-directed RNA polymerase subunit RPC12/RpoP